MMTPLLLTTVLLLICVLVTSACKSYTPLADGVTTYDIDDGGCFFCATQDHAYETLGFGSDVENGAIPLSGQELMEHCESLCNADARCIAFTIARPAILSSDYYMWGKTANCCLDRMPAPPELFIDATVLEEGQEELSMCQLGAMCWTRFERDVKKGCNEEELQAVASATTLSDQCTMVWGDRTYTPDEIHHKMKYVKNGCVEDSETFYHMLEEAYGVCKAEVDQEVGNFEKFEDGE